MWVLTDRLEVFCTTIVAVSNHTSCNAISPSSTPIDDCRTISKSQHSLPLHPNSSPSGCLHVSQHLVLKPHWELHKCFRHFFATDRRSVRKHKRLVECRVSIVDHERCVEQVYGGSRSLGLNANLNLMRWCGTVKDMCKCCCPQDVHLCVCSKANNIWFKIYIALLLHCWGWGSIVFATWGKVFVVRMP